jgi:hypothetical protein
MQKLVLFRSEGKAPRFGLPGAGGLRLFQLPAVGPVVVAGYDKVYIIGEPDNYNIRVKFGKAYI